MTGRLDELPQLPGKGTHVLKRAIIATLSCLAVAAGGVAPATAAHAASVSGNAARLASAASAASAATTGSAALAPSAATTASGTRTPSPAARAAAGAIPLSWDFYEVKDYGAVADGTTNASPAVDRAIVAANAAGGGLVNFVPGTYLAGSSIHLLSNVIL